MRIKITHHTHYAYGGEVTLEPHTLRFCPRNDGGQKLIDFDIQIEPEPSLLTSCLDLEGNVVTHARFQTPASKLSIRTSCEVETNHGNPYGFVITSPEAATLPMIYPPEYSSRLDPYCEHTPIEWEVRAFSDAVAAAAGWDTLRFLPLLNERIHQECRYEPRPVGDPYPSGLTLRTKTGACRDLAVLYMDACRAQGLAARFVSGYRHGSDVTERNEMHAWAEVYLPGGGWRGFDPSHALAVSDQLVAVAAAAESRDASPVSGTFRGRTTTPRLAFQISVE